MSKLLQEIGMLLGFNKVNTTAYHPQTDGLVERFNRTLIDMLAKIAEQIGMKSYPLCSLLIGLLHKSLWTSHLFDYFMAGILSFLRKMLCLAQ